MNNTFIIDGRELKYKITSDVSEYDYWVKTEFYETFDTKKKRKWIFWGDEYEVIIPHTMFTIYQDFHSTRLTKEYWRREITKKLKKYDSLQKRESEIKNGELV